MLQWNDEQQMWQPRSLRDLADEHLGWSIQNGPGHNPAEDTEAAMALYQRFSEVHVLHTSVGTIMSSQLKQASD